MLKQAITYKRSTQAVETSARESRRADVVVGENSMQQARCTKQDRSVDKRSNSTHANAWCIQVQVSTSTPHGSPPVELHPPSCKQRAKTGRIWQDMSKNRQNRRSSRVMPVLYSSMVLQMSSSCTVELGSRH